MHRQMSQQTSTQKDKSIDSLPRRISTGNLLAKSKLQNEAKLPKSPLSLQSTPKKTKNTDLNLIVCGTSKQITKMALKANSMPIYHRRQSMDSLLSSNKSFSPKSFASKSSRSRGTSVENESMGLSLSQLTDYEDGFLRNPPNTSTPRSKTTYSASAHTKTTTLRSTDGNNSSFTSQDSKTSSAGNFRYKTAEHDYSSMSPSPESTRSSVSARSQVTSDLAVVSPFSQTNLSESCCMSWVDSTDQTKVAKTRDNGEWDNFWVDYNNSSRVPMSYYDQCPTPYRTEDIDYADLELLPETSTNVPKNVKSINRLIRNEGISLNPRETQNVIKCAHILNNVLATAITRNTRQLDIKQNITETQKTEIDVKKKNFKLNLKEQVNVEDQNKNQGTQTDISLPNTKSAPRIFEKILRQLSKSSIDETVTEEKKNDGQEESSKKEE